MTPKLNPELEELLDMLYYYCMNNPKLNIRVLEKRLQEISDKLDNYEILKSGLEEICNSIDYDYNPMDTEERMKKLLEKVNKK